MLTPSHSCRYAYAELARDAADENDEFGDLDGAAGDHELSLAVDKSALTFARTAPATSERDRDLSQVALTSVAAPDGANAGRTGGREREHTCTRMKRQNEWPKWRRRSKSSSFLFGDDFAACYERIKLVTQIQLVFLVSIA